MIEYKDIPNYPGYRVGSDGSVWSCKNGKWGLREEWKQLKPSRVKTPYSYDRYMVALGRGNQKYVHRLVLETFVGECPPGMEGCHNDGDASNNAIHNLRWDTRLGNMRDMAEQGKKKGERHHNAILNNELVREIRKRAASGETHQSIADSLNLKRRNVSKIIDGSRWGHVT